VRIPSVGKPKQLSSTGVDIQINSDNVAADQFDRDFV
jgi:hypothetical protein